MRTLIAGLLFLPALSYAAPFKSTTISVNVNRQSIHDQKDAAVATAAPFKVRYSPTDSRACFVMIPNYEIQCTSTINSDGDVYITLTENDLKNLFHSLTWTDATYASEFELSYQKQKWWNVTFYSHSSKVKYLTLDSFQITTDDKKTIYTVY